MKLMKVKQMLPLLFKEDLIVVRVRVIIFEEANM
jgi:hypothetical protein